MNRDLDHHNKEPQRPVETVRDGDIKSSIWRNTGERGDYHSATFARTYRDNDGNVRDANSFIGTDILKLSEITRQTYNRCRELDREIFKERRAQRETTQDRERPHER